MSESELLVRRINDGTVIDHIDEGKGLHVLSAMGIDGKDGGLVCQQSGKRILTESDGDIARAILLLTTA